MILCDSSANNECLDEFCRCEINSDILVCGSDIFTVYGITVFLGNKIIAEYPDLSDKSEKVRELCKLINKSKVGEKHVHDIIEDFASELHYLM